VFICEVNIRGSRHSEIFGQVKLALNRIHGTGLQRYIDVIAITAKTVNNTSSVTRLRNLFVVAFTALASARDKPKD
jgi:hypothetical protein